MKSIYFFRSLLMMCAGLCLSSCLQTENSSSLDAELYVEASAEFQAAKGVMAQNCVPCHSYHSRTEAQLISAGLVVAGNPEASELYYRIIGSTGTNGPKDMPQSGSISPGSVAVISAWITAM